MNRKRLEMLEEEMNAARLQLQRVETLRTAIERIRSAPPAELALCLILHDPRNPDTPPFGVCEADDFGNSMRADWVAILEEELSLAEDRFSAIDWKEGDS